jgi:DNA primase catalytic core
MARIPENEIERLKREISVQRLAEARGIKLTKQGADLLGKCPFHNDRTPSLVITPAKNLWHCLGACGRGGDVIEWVMLANGISFRHAVELLRKDHLPLAASPIKPVKVGTVRVLPAPVAADADDHALLSTIVGFYQETLKQSPEAQRYLEGRGLKSAEMVERFRLGFANRTLGYRLEAKNRAGGAAVRGRLQKLGIYRESGHEHFNGSLVIPVFHAGEVVEMYGRKITPNLREGTPNHLYLPGEHRGVWNEEALIASKEIILCESLIDALTFWVAGFRNVTASYGVNGFTRDHKAAFEKHGIERLYIAYDRDEAGDKAATKLASELIETGIECYRIEFPKGMDANEYALKVTPAAKSLGVLLNRATWLGKGQRSASRVIVPETITEPAPAAEEPAAKETIIIEAAAPEPTPEPENWLRAAAEEAAPVLPLADVAASSGPQVDVPVELRGDDVLLRFEDREYRVRGLQKNTSPELLKINLRVLGVNRHGDMALHVDTLELTSSRQRMAFCKQAAEELNVKEDLVRRELGRVMLKLEQMRDEQIAKALAPKEPTATMTEEERNAAMELLRDPRLMERILEDFARCGTVGEETNKLVGYLGAVSRHLEKPLAVIVQSSSAAGKSSLMDAVLAFVPEEQRVQYSAMTGQSLFYMGDTDLQHKVLAIVEEAGAQRASYALKLLQSEGEVSIASTGKDPVSGRHVTHEYRVKGPVMIFLTTTAIDIDEELLNRCLVLTVNEDRAQTQAIHRIQRESQTIEGLLRRRDRDELLRLHRNAQRLLRPVIVVNEQAMELSFPDSMTRTRRDHMKFLTLIRSITFLHQWQREVKTTMHRGQPVEYIEATAEDVELAKKLIHEVLGRSLDDMPAQTRRLLLMIDGMVTAECEREKLERAEYRFSRRDVREFSAWSDSQLKRHLARLEDLEYLIVHRGGRGQSFVYELFFERPADEAASMLPGLEHEYDAKKSGLEAHKSGGSSAQVRGMSAGSVGDKSPVSMRVTTPFYEDASKSTSRGETKSNHVVVVQPGVNGNGHAGGTAWPA